MIGKALVFGGSAAVPLAIMAAIFVAVFAYFALDSFDAGDAYDGKVAVWLAGGYAAAVAAFSAAVAVLG